MIYPFMPLDDNTEIVNTELLPDNRVKVYIEKPDANDCFHDMTCYLPDYEIVSVNGFSEEEVAEYMSIIRSTAHLIIEFAKEGGFLNASGL